VKLTAAPGARLGKLKITVLGVGVTRRTTTLVRVTLPALLTVPLKVRRPPRGVGASGQASVTAILAVPCTGQVAVADAETSAPEHLSRTFAVRVEAMVQPLFAGTV